MFSKARIVTLGVLVVGALVLASGAAVAQATTSFNVTASVLKSCTVSADALDFGNYDPLGAAGVPGSTTLRVKCTKNTATTIALDNGGNYSSGTRHMVLGSESLAYDLFTDNTYSTPWGGGTTVALTTTNNGTNNVTVYGRIAAGQNVAAGLNYQDTVNVTVNY